MAILLTLGFIRLLTIPGTTVLSMAPTLVLQLGLGLVSGYLMGRVMVWALNRARLRQEGLYAVFSVALVLLAFGATALLGGSGFVAVYVAGIILGNRTVVHKRSISRFHDGLAWLMQITMFLTLGLLVFPTQLARVAGAGLLTAFVLMLVARPVSVVLSLFWARYGWRDLAVISWAGLRGAAPIVLATFPLIAGVSRAAEIFNIVFFVVLVSVLLQGTTIRWVARWLGVQAEESPHPSEEHSFAPEVRLNSRLVTLSVPADSAMAGKAIVEIGLPRGALVVQIVRGAETLIPSGSLVLEAGDELYLLVTPETIEMMRGFGAIRLASIAEMP
jgi:cell volume regulation protein A